MKKNVFKLTAVAALLCLALLPAGCKQLNCTSMKDVATLIEAGNAAPDSQDRVLIVDVRSSTDFIQGHIKNALTAPLDQFAQDGEALYTNSVDEVSPTAAEGIANAWFAHVLINQLVNDFSSTYADSRIIFYGSTIAQAMQAARVAQLAGYTHVSYMIGSYGTWAKSHEDLTAQYFEGVESVDEDNATFIMTGYINDINFDNCSTRGTHHGIIFKGGGLHNNGLLQVNIAPFCFQELLTYLGASPEGNMAEGISYDENYAALFNTEGQKIEYSVTWDTASRYYAFTELYEEKESIFEPDNVTFELLGLESRIGGTRDSNLNYNPGCIFCLYSCVCGITSNSKANDNIWFADGGTYDMTMASTNYYAGRYYPRMDIMPGQGTDIKIKVKIVK
jgi:rhodanese-related sulfurtransferase